MTNHVLLNNIDHANLKVKTGHSGLYGSRVGLAPVFPTEFSEVQREYPILLRRNNAESCFQAVALLGFAEDENLFLDESAQSPDHAVWRADYVPCILERGPFLIGFREQESGGVKRREPIIHVDMDSPRIDGESGEAVFLPHGGNSPYLERVASILKSIHDGMAISDDMFKLFSELDLIEPVNLDIEIHRDEKLQLAGYFTVNEEALGKLDGAALKRLNDAGFLAYAYFIAASLGNIRRLIQRKRQRIMNASKVSAKQ